MLTFLLSVSLPNLKHNDAITSWMSLGWGNRQWGMKLECNGEKVSLIQFEGPWGGTLFKFLVVFFLLTFSYIHWCCIEYALFSRMFTFQLHIINTKFKFGSSSLIQQVRKREKENSHFFLGEFAISPERRPFQMMTLFFCFFNMEQNSPNATPLCYYRYSILQSKEVWCAAQLSWQVGCFACVRSIDFLISQLWRIL